MSDKSVSLRKKQNKGGPAMHRSILAALDSFLALYEATKQPRWLAHALSAADYTESWIWNVPLPGNVPDPHCNRHDGPKLV